MQGHWKTLTNYLNKHTLKYPRPQAFRERRHSYCGSIPIHIYIYICWAVCRTRNSRAMELSPHCIVPRVSSCVFNSDLHWEKSMGESRLFPINLSPILKHTGVKSSLILRLYPRTQTNCNVKRDGVWQIWQPDGICQTASSRRQTPSARRRI